METSPDANGRETRPVPIKGRNIDVRELTDAQLLLMSRDVRLAQREGVDKKERVGAIGRMFDILESVVVSPDDKEYLLDLVVKGNLELADMTPVLTAFKDEEPEQQEKPKVRRGRPPAKRTQ
jgi:hypothetical protein